jgi:hypothetical protein
VRAPAFILPSFNATAALHVCTLPTFWCGSTAFAVPSSAALRYALSLP